MGLQYRTAAYAGIATQFFWGFMEIIAMRAFYEADPAAFPMTMRAICDYVWLQQAFLALLSPRIFDGEILETVRSGNIAYELCRPVQVYDMWFAKSVAGRISGAALRCVPVLLTAFILPEPYGMSAPKDFLQSVLFLVSMGLALLVVTAFGMLIYVTGIYTISTDGIKMLTISLADFLTGGLIPLPFFPEGVRAVLELLPFAAMQNVPLRIYSGDLAGARMYRAVFLQLFWFGVLLAVGKVLCRRGERRLTVQGG